MPGETGQLPHESASTPAPAGLDSILTGKGVASGFDSDLKGRGFQPRR